MTYNTLSSDHARNTIIAARQVFDAMTADGQAGQEADQGGNYYVDDPVESRNFGRFLELVAERAPMIGNKVLVAACGDGLETELLAEQGYQVTAFDFSPNMVAATRNRLEARNAERGQLGLPLLNVELFVDDLTDVQTDRYGDDFVGVTVAQAVQFLPVVGEQDELAKKAITDLAACIPGGVMYVSTTQYADPAFVRQWGPEEAGFGSTVYYARPTEVYERHVGAAGLEVMHKEFFDAGDNPPDDYKNLYIVAARPL